MAILTVGEYMPHMALPVYMKLQPSQHNDHNVGEVYEVRVEDKDRSEGGSYNYTHEAELVSVRQLKWRDVSPMLIAYQGFAKGKEEATKRISPDGSSIDPEREMQLLVFLRIDAAQEYITGDCEPIPGDFTKSDMEDDNK